MQSVIQVKLSVYCLGDTAMNSSSEIITYCALAAAEC